MLLGGYCVLEVCTLLLFKFKPRTAGVRIRPLEFRLRAFLMAVCIVFIVLFQIAAVQQKHGEVAATEGRAAEFFGVDITCCPDEWVRPQENTIFDSRHHVLPLEYGAFGRQKVQLKNSASGILLTLKQFEYIMEFLASVTAIFSHIVIWFYCD